ncbi:TonB-dependent receptor [Methylotenera sp.]|uniref:TonB-dependent receptor domain-containing protein n=1 Tax=Methylotenera sp. TaxID=2051956 RepID=UPI0024876E0F|nr:TonB-dependent receptor [Methylotenera sp.]MDI1363127.1 TonB-dependent receptor [Methylotenera sp.]
MKKSTIASLVALAFSPSAFAAETAIQTDDVVVTASRVAQPRESVIADVTVIDREKIEQSGQSTIVDLLQQQSGIEVSSNGGLGKSASIRIRGANDNHTIILVDGLRVNSATLGTTSIQHIPLNQVEKIEILRGPSSSLYGSEGIGGTIQIFTRQSSGEPRFNISVGTGSYNTQDLSAGVSGRVSDTSFSLQAGYIRSDGFSATNKKDKNNYFSDDDGYKNKNISAKIAQHFGEKHEVGITLFHTDADDQYDSSFYDSGTNTLKFQDFNYRENQKLTAASIYSKNQFTSNWLSTLKVGVGIDSLKFYDPNATNTASVESSIKTKQNEYMWQNDITLPVGKLSLSAEKLEQEVSGTTDYSKKKRDINSLLAGWVANFDKHDVQANLRTDNNSQFGHHNTWYAGYGYQLADNWKATIGHGTAFNAPTFNQLYYPLDSSGSVGNPNLKAEESRNTEASIRFNNSDRDVKLTAYHNKVTNLIDWQFNNTTFLFSPVNIANATLKGLSLSDSEHLGNLTISANLDVQSARDEATDEFLSRRAQRHGQVGAYYKINKLSIGANVFAESQRDDSGFNNNKTAGYGILNLTAAYVLNSNWSVKANVNNILNKDYELAYGYNTAGTNAFVGVTYAPSK